MLLASLRYGMPASLTEVAVAFGVDEDRLAQLWLDLSAAGLMVPVGAQ